MQRYMLDAEHAEAAAQPAAEKVEERAGSGEPGGHETSARRPIRPTTERRRAEKLLSEEETVWGNGRPGAKETERARKALARADKQAAKQAAQRIAMLEKKEARERKALAKAAARRRTR